MLIVLNCGERAQARHPQVSPFIPRDAEVRDVSEVPKRAELKFLDEFPERFVTGHTPSLDEIAAQPNVAHLGIPQPDPHPVSESVRIVLSGNDAALSTLVTKLMRIDAMWVEVAYLPLEHSDITNAWGIPASDPLSRLVPMLLKSASTPRPVIRDDHGVVTLAKATITGPVDKKGEVTEMVGEVIVDSKTIYNHGGPEDPSSAPGMNPGNQLAGFNNGVTMAPTALAPGLVAIPRKPLIPKGFFKGLRARATAERMQPTVTAGRALQAGGVDLQVIRDGVPHPRPLNSVTFYRHLRDGQFVTFSDFGRH